MNKQLSKQDLGNLMPKRGSDIAPKIAAAFLKISGWQIAGNIPNIPQAVLIAAPHTSNIDGVYAISTVLALDLDIKILGKKQLFAVPILSQFLRWVGVVPIDRDKKGSVLQSTIDRFKTGKPLFLALAPEGTRGYTTHWKTGFYYLAVEAGVPIIPVAMDYATKQIRFMMPFYPTGDIDNDLPKLYQYYKHIRPKHPKKLSQVIQNIQS